MICIEIIGIDGEKVSRLLTFTISLRKLIIMIYIALLLLKRQDIDRSFLQVRPYNQMNQFLIRTELKVSQRHRLMPKRYVGHVWRIGRVDAFLPKGHGFDSRSSRHAGTLGKSFTHNCLFRFGVKFRTVSVLCRERLWVVVDLKRRYRMV